MEARLLTISVQSHGIDCSCSSLMTNTIYAGSQLVIYESYAVGYITEKDSQQKEHFPPLKMTLSDALHILGVADGCILLACRSIYHRIYVCIGIRL